MKASRLTAHDIANEICRTEGVAYDDIYKMAKALLVRYSRGQSYASEKCEDETVITKQKQSIRRRYINIMKDRTNYSEQDYTEFVWDVVKASWFLEKARMILDKIEMLVDGAIDARTYDPIKDRELEGKLLKTIITKAYLTGKYSAKVDNAVTTLLELPRSTYYRKKKDAVVLFGILMWTYAKRRENEDIELGIIKCCNT